MNEEYQGNAQFLSFLDDITSLNEENNVIAGVYTDVIRDRQWRINWKTGRFEQKIDGEEAVAQSAIKYLLTERDQDPLYGDEYDVTESYGGAMWTLLNQTYLDADEARLALQGVCDAACEQLPDVKEIQVYESSVKEDRLYAKLNIVPVNGTEREVIVDGLQF